MADQLLSQADVDALVASLSKSDPPKPAAPAVKPPAPVQAPATVATKPVAAAMPARPSAPAIRAAAPVNFAANAPRPTPAPVKSDMNNDVINGLNARIAELSKQVGSLSATLKKMEMLEKKVAELEAKVNKNAGGASADQKVQQLTDEMKKIVTNLKGTPGYGVRNTFNCEKCDDHGHVAVQFRCTKCGHERWYGWWPEKKK